MARTPPASTVQRLCSCHQTTSASPANHPPNQRPVPAAPRPFCRGCGEAVRSRPPGTGLRGAVNRVTAGLNPHGPERPLPAPLPRQELGDALGERTRTRTRTGSGSGCCRVSEPPFSPKPPQTPSGLGPAAPPVPSLLRSPRTGRVRGHAGGVEPEPKLLPRQEGAEQPAAQRRKVSVSPLWHQKVVRRSSFPG